MPNKRNAEAPKHIVIAIGSIIGSVFVIILTLVIYLDKSKAVSLSTIDTKVEKHETLDIHAGARGELSEFRGEMKAQIYHLNKNDDRLENNQDRLEGELKVLEKHIYLNK